MPPLAKLITTWPHAGAPSPAGFAPRLTPTVNFWNKKWSERTYPCGARRADVEDAMRWPVTAKTVVNGSWTRHSPRRWIKRSQRVLQSSNGKRESGCGSTFFCYAEDLPDASFAAAGNLPEYPRLDNVIPRSERGVASLFNDRALPYRVHQGF